MNVKAHHSGSLKGKLRGLLKRLALFALVVLVVGSVGLVVLRAFEQHRVAVRTRFIAPENSIASLEKVRLGDLDQWVQIRGQDRSRPVLLFLHGGPGFPQMPFAHQDAALEKEFVVVQWDQRGSGKSYSTSVPASSMNVEQFVADACELTQVLRARFGGRKIYLVAHSWGTVIGALCVARHPGWFQAYVAIGQVANLLESGPLDYQFALDAARREGNAKAVAELTGIPKIPCDNFRDFSTMQKWVEVFSRQDYSPVTPGRFARLAFESPAYSWADLARIPLGFRFSLDHLWRELSYHVDLFQQVPRLDVPVYFFTGRHDRVVAAPEVQRYFDALDAPRGKQLVWFEHSGHWPHFEEPERYCAALVGRVLKETAPVPAGTSTESDP